MDKTIERATTAPIDTAYHSGVSIVR
jgi:hypothetical protein